MNRPPPLAPACDKICRPHISARSWSAVVLYRFSTTQFARETANISTNLLPALPLPKKKKKKRVDRVLFWKLELGNSLELGRWCLELFKSLHRLLFPFYLFTLCLFLSIIPQPAITQPVSDDVLKKIQFDQKLGAHISLNTQFRDETGKPVRLGDYFGKKPVILVLGYYGCPMLCTFVLNGLIGSLQDIKWEIGNQFEVINISIDPNETPVLAAAKKKAYVRRYGRHDASQGWHFLTGGEPAIRRLAGEVGFNYAYDPAIKQYAHPSGLVILTSQGEVTHYLSGVIYSTKGLNDALVGASNRKIGSPVQQLFLLCFHYSPITGKYGSLIMIVVRVFGVAILLALAGCIAAMFRREAAKNVSKTDAKTVTGES